MEADLHMFDAITRGMSEAVYVRDRDINPLGNCSGQTSEVFDNRLAHCKCLKRPMFCAWISCNETSEV